MQDLYLSCFLSSDELQFLQIVNSHPRLIPRHTTYQELIKLDTLTRSPTITDNL